jgi:hypothetical protein
VSQLPRQPSPGGVILAIAFVFLLGLVLGFILGKTA